MRLTHTDRLHLFTAAYGRFLVLAAQALADDAGTGDVRNAMSARANGPIPANLMALRDRRNEWLALYHTAKASGVPTVDVVNRMRDLHAAVAGEWCVAIPVARD